MRNDQAERQEDRRRLRKSECQDDWYVVDGSGAQPEGTAAEWRLVVDAIKAKRSEQPGRRIGVTVYDDGRVKFLSPRNCTGPDDVVRIAANDVEAWLASAEALLANDKLTDGSANNP